MRKILGVQMSRGQRLGFWITAAFFGLGTVVAVLFFLLSPSKRDVRTLQQDVSKLRGVKYSSSQVLQMSSVPGNYTQELNLDNVATLCLFPPCSRETATLYWPTSQVVTVAEPRADEQYKVPGGGAVQVPQAGRGLEVRGLTLVGQAQPITFDQEHQIRLIRVGERIFRIRLVHATDKSNADTAMFLEYTFAISEEDNNAENLAAAITLEQPKGQSPADSAHGYLQPQGPPRPDDEEARNLLTVAMDSQPAGTIVLRLRAVVNGQPNVWQLSAQTKSFRFDPIARVVTFRMKTNALRPVNLHLPLGTTPFTNGYYYVAFAWDVSAGARLCVNYESVSDGLK